MIFDFNMYKKNETTYVKTFFQDLNVISILIQTTYIFILLGGFDHEATMFSYFFM